MTEDELNLYDSASGLSTLAQLDAALPARKLARSAVQTWLQKVSATRIDRLADDDLVRAVGVGMHLPVTAVEALRRLSKDLWIGADYPGQLLELVLQAPSELWHHYPPLLDAALMLAGRLRQTSEQAAAQTAAQTAATERAARGVQAARWTQLCALALAFERATRTVSLEISGPDGSAAGSLCDGGEFLCGSDATADLYLDPAQWKAPKQTVKLSLDGAELTFVVADTRVLFNGKQAPLRGQLRGGDTLQMGPYRLARSR